MHLVSGGRCSHSDVRKHGTPPIPTHNTYQVDPETPARYVIAFNRPSSFISLSTPRQAMWARSPPPEPRTAMTGAWALEEEQLEPVDNARKRGHPRTCLGRVASVPCRFSGRVSSYLFTHPSCSSWMSWAAEPGDSGSNPTSMKPHLHLPGQPGCSAFAEPPTPWSCVCSQPPSLLSGVQWQSKHQSFPGQRGKIGTVRNFAVSKQRNFLEFCPPKNYLPAAGCSGAKVIKGSEFSLSNSENIN